MGKPRPLLRLHERHEVPERQVHVGGVEAPVGSEYLLDIRALVAGVLDPRDEEPGAVTLLDAAGFVSRNESNP